MTPQKHPALHQFFQEASMIVGYEMGHRLKEKRRAEIKFARMEQFQQWFLASAPGW
jgi:hypothetical protein